MPLLRFADSCPVYFDRHTLSLKAGQLSMFTLDGRMRFQLALGAEAEEAFQKRKLREIVLSRASGDRYTLSFVFSDSEIEASSSPVSVSEEAEIPEYVMVDEL